jgi:valyl-tRNA synthetase
MKTMLSFLGDTLEGTTIEKPFKQPGELPLIADVQLKSSFGTGLHSITPAHDIAALRFSYAHNLSRDGIICPVKGTLLQPIFL